MPTTHKKPMLFELLDWNVTSPDWSYTAIKPVCILVTFAIVGEASYNNDIPLEYAAAYPAPVVTDFVSV